MYKTSTDVKRELLKQHYEANYGQLVKRAKRYLGEFWAEDCVQDAYDRLFTYVDNIPFEYVELNPYVNTVVGNVIKRYQADKIGYFEIEENMLVSSELAKSEEDKDRVKQILDSLSGYSPSDRSILYSYLIQGAKREQVAKTHEVPFFYVKNLIQKFRKEIKDV